MHMLHDMFSAMQERRQVDSPTQTLMRGLEILRVLVESRQPLSATEIGRRFGLHQSTVSRILATLAAQGYVRKVDYRSFAPDYGVLALGVAASGDFRLMVSPRAAMEDAAQICDGLQVSLCLLWHDQMVYLIRTHRDQPPIPFSAAGFPMHLSSPALRMLIDMPDSEALRLLAVSRQRQGWARPTAQVPETAEAVLEAAKGLLHHDCVILNGWLLPDHITGATLIRDDKEEHPLAVALSGPATSVSPDKLLVLLHESRRLIETALSDS
jgi:DNA-binding IclR family transcriptional regulator